MRGSPLEPLELVDFRDSLWQSETLNSLFEFLEDFGGRLRAAGVGFAITSGMACVRYGLQQTTKDSDWIIELEALDALRAVVQGFEAQMPPGIATYRPIFGAPLDARWHRGGWTTHVAIQLHPNEIPHHLDFFGRPPRVATWRVDSELPDFADRATVIRMKKTDRDRDWPMVDGLAIQEMTRNKEESLLHIQSASILRQAWERTIPEKRAVVVGDRPVLRMLDEEPDDLQVEAAIRAERLVWESVNRERYRLYQSEWKAFYRRWQSEPDWLWPTVEPFAAQHARLVAAAIRHSLPQSPLDGPAVREELFHRGLARAAVLSRMSESELLALSPPISEILPP